MQNLREKAARNRAKNSRTLTKREIKLAICDHARLAITEPPAQQTAGGVWHTKLTCPACGTWQIRETLDTVRPAPAAQAREQEQEQAAALAVG